MGQVALAGMQHVAGVPGAADAVAAMLQQGQTAAMKAAQIKAQKLAVEAAKEKNQQLKEKRQDDLVNAAAVSGSSSCLHGAELSMLTVLASYPVSSHIVVFTSAGAQNWAQSDLPYVGRRCNHISSHLGSHFC